MFTKHQVIGHRGACAFAPENTLASFKRAYALGCRFIEFDVQLSADGEAFVFHDETLERTTSGLGVFSHANADYLQSLDAGRWFSKAFVGEKIPTLFETIEWLSHLDMQANIEIKSSSNCTEQTVTIVLNQINRHWPTEKALPLISSFNVEALHVLHRLAPDMPCALLLSEWNPDWLIIARELGCVSINLSLHFVTKTMVHEIKQQGFAVCVYTVNRKRVADKLFKWGVDAIFSDYSDMIQLKRFF